MPLEVDDDYITTSGTSGQPGGMTSYMSGFVANSRIFQVLGQAQLRQRTFAHNFDAGPSPNQLLHWIARAQATLRKILDELPADLREDFKTHQFDEKMDSHLGVSQANIHISALCVEFALVSLRILRSRSSISKPSCGQKRTPSQSASRWRVVRMRYSQASRSSTSRRMERAWYVPCFKANRSAARSSASCWTSST